jgi:cytochrome P450 / NADPH-cytochrome P450 reductase
MHDIASQLVLKWARKGPSYRIPVADDFTRLTLDTIALCTMDFRYGIHIIFGITNLAVAEIGH